MTNYEKLLWKQIYKKSLYDFVKDFWSCADPSTFIDGKLVKYYCEAFQYMCRNFIPCSVSTVEVSAEYKEFNVVDIRENKRNLCLNVPPRHSKSMVLSVLAPVWVWLNTPLKVATISHTFGLSKDINMKRQKLINSEKFQFFFGDEINLISNTNDLLRDTRGGELYAKNRNALTGFGGDIIINDDLTNAETARKDKEEMSSAWAYYQNTMPSRINNVNTGVIINIQQRLAPNDITGHIINDPKLASTYSFIILPAVFEEDTAVVCPLSGDILVFKKGEGLWPERFGNYEGLRYQAGESIFQTQYLQKPVATDRTVVKTNMIIEKDIVDVPEISAADMVYASHDFPVKDKETSDFLGSVLAYKVGSNLYIKDCLEKRMAFVKSIEYCMQLDEHYPGIIQVIEDKANGAPIIQQLQDRVAGLQPFQTGTKSKTQRLDSATFYMDAGNVIFVRDQFDKLSQSYKLSDSLQNLETKLLNFPFVEHDDICDAFSQLVLFVFMDKRFAVYGRSFNDANVISYESKSNDYSTIFFNKEGDLWKICEIAVVYGSPSKIIVTREKTIRANVEEGIKKLKEFAPSQNVFIDCSVGESLYGMNTDGLSIEKYMIDDFEKSVVNLNLAFSKNIVLLNKDCKLTKADIENFKYDKTKDDTAKFKTEKDGYGACLRIAMKYYSI